MIFDGTFDSQSTSNILERLNDSAYNNYILRELQVRPQYCMRNAVREHIAEDARYSTTWAEMRGKEFCAAKFPLAARSAFSAGNGGIQKLGLVTQPHQF